MDINETGSYFFSFFRENTNHSRDLRTMLHSSYHLNKQLNVQKFSSSSIPFSNFLEHIFLIELGGMSLSVRSSHIKKIVIFCEFAMYNNPHSHFKSM